jgi:hypothetical protein
MKNLIKQIYCGVVEQTDDEDRIGRIKVRVQGVFDDMPLEDIPWAEPFRNLSGKGFEIPRVGKLVNIIFHHGNIYNPQYIYSENYNVNLQGKLSEITEEDYEGFIALLFDHRTQVFADDKELTWDYKYNKITITNTNINFELKDNNQRVNIGTKEASQQAMLGNHWLEWFDELARVLQNDTASLGNGMIIVPPQPIIKAELSYKILVDYWAKRETFISDHVYITDDRKIKKLE